MAFGSQFTAPQGGPTFSYLSPDGQNVTVVLWVAGQAVGGVTLNPTGTTSQTFTLTNMSVTVSIASSGSPATTTLSWSYAQNQGSTVSGTMGSWPTP
jgi:hypothetical protein